MAEEGKYEESVKVFEQARLLADRHLEHNDELRLKSKDVGTSVMERDFKSVHSVILVLHSLGHSYNVNGEYTKAEIILEDVVDIKRTKREPDLFFARGEIYLVD